MELIEINAVKRSGHHAFMSWIIKNIYGLNVEYIHKLIFVADTGLWVWNDASRYQDLGTNLLKHHLMIKPPKSIMVNYEDEDSNYSLFHTSNYYHGSKNFDRFIEVSKSKRFYIIRDFYNNLASRFNHENKHLHTNDYGMKYINRWKDIAKMCLSNPNSSIKYEDLVTNTSKCYDFLQHNFDIVQKFNLQDVGKTKSSFENSYNTLDRFDVKMLPKETISLIKDDNELHYYIGALKYDYREL